MSDEDEQLRAEHNILATRIEAVLELHSALNIYDECGHDHEWPDEPGVVEVEEIGLTCADGLLYQVCRECCVHVEQYQSEECVDHHDQSHCWPCRTVRAATGVT